MDVIKILDKKVAEKIAAGEVVQDPASVVKELCENSIDAKAKNITIEIVSGGTELIKITDDGIGMSFNDAKTAFLRHATSKITTEADLNKAYTLGFRGEALCSIAAVSKVALYTKQREAESGIEIKINGSEPVYEDICYGKDGTVITVSDLFYNVPARKKFLKSEASEAAAVSLCVEKLALSHPEISFKLIRNQKEVFRTNGDGVLKNAVTELFSKEFTDSLIEIEHKDPNEFIKIRGLIAKPVYSRANRRLQFFFVNQRTIVSKILQSALEEAYRDRLLVSSYPSCILFIDIDPEYIDVNVHPAKTQIKFSNEKFVTDNLIKAINKALDEDSGKEKIKITKESFEFIPDINVTVEAEQDNIFKDKEETVYPVNYMSEVERPNFSDFSLPVFEVVKEEKEEPLQKQQEYKIEQTAPVKYIGEIFKSYIIAEQNDEIYIIDKHAAHERIIYDEIKNINLHDERQLLLSPLIIRFDSLKNQALLSNKDDLLNFGFVLDDFGAGNIIVNEIPSVLVDGDVVEALSEFADSYALAQNVSSFAFKDKLMHTIACKAAIKAGWDTSSMEKEKLLNDLLSKPDVKYCPHGRPIVFVLEKSELEKYFKRS